MATIAWAPSGTITLPVQDHVWDTWYYTDVTTASYYTQNVVWNNWVTASTTGGITFTAPANPNITITGSTIQTQVWREWQQMGVAAETAAAGLRRFGEWTETDEERVAREDRQQQERERRSRERLAAQHRLEGAQERALELLEMVLTPEERLMRDNTGVVTVRGSAGGLYEVGMGEWGTVHGNIKATDEHGCMLGRLCVAPGMYDHQARAALPLADGWVGQVLGLKFNEVEFVAKANWSSRRPCQMPDVPVLRAA